MAFRVKLPHRSINNHINNFELSKTWSRRSRFCTTTEESNSSAKQEQSQNQINSYVRPYPPNFRDISHQFEDDHPFKDVDFKTLALDPLQIEKLANFVQTAKRLVVITGAGISYVFIAVFKFIIVLITTHLRTDSGIPDYRGPNGSYRYIPLL